jgi:hypothetical protein
MPKIFVNTDNSNVKGKIYLAEKMGKSAGAAEKKMQEVVRALIAKAPEFTADTAAKGKGYTIRIEVTNAERGAGKTTYTVHFELVRFPPGTGAGGSKGEEMVSTRTKDLTIVVSSNSESMLLDGVEGVTENIVAKAIPSMRVDMTSR